VLVASPVIVSRYSKVIANSIGPNSIGEQRLQT